ncbi:thioredoxin family protein [Methylobacillus arboreus]|uniref:protein-disulfide reductase DsbD family protein n=1 Tax=Methylobacillus arboreus TaxID=755170 RepID=UPI001E61D73C|nr:protein-disulfide reductase DsbD domain-containing protein [Methylobacillus arboreus]MCB5190130.1 thioredoxin family protein [Methylobacillus arboreus]
MLKRSDMGFRYLASVLFLLLMVSANAYAASEAATDQVKARLVASVESVHAGDEITVGINQRIIPHWHTYWINPGDSGMATSIAWTLPAGAEAGDIQWPIPHKFNVGPITNYGYADEVTLLTNIRVPESLKPGESFPVKALVNWLVCDDVCIPQEVELTLSLPVVDAGVDGGKGSELIAKAREQLPVESPWQVSAYEQKQGPLLKIPGKVLEPGSTAEVWFFPEEWGRVSHKSRQPRRIDSDAFLLQLTAGDNPLAAGESLKGVLVISKQISTGVLAQGYQLEVKLEPGIAESIVDEDPAQLEGADTSTGEDISLYSALLFALLGGVILNLMPCVFPVLSIKALSLLQHKQSQHHTRLHGWAYTAGVLASFVLLGLVLIGLKSAGSQVGWGFQFQSPIFVVLVAYLMFTVGLSLSGVLTIGSSFAGVGSSLADKSGYSGSFFTGVLATIVATPCTAPFMGGALGYALTQPAVVLLAVFLSLGFGLALPYLLLSHWPSLQRFLPKPGIWMERFKQVLAFPMYAAAVWLVWVLAQQAGPNAVALALAGMVLIALLAWIYEITRHGSNKKRYAANTVSLLGLLVLLYGSYSGIQLFAGSVSTANTASAAGVEKNWEAYSEQRLGDLRDEGKPVFINLTAAWCITCLVNEQVALSQQSVADAFSKSGITYLKGDWTNQDKQITQLLKQFGRSGVPLYILYPPGKDAKPQVLPQILTPEIVLNAVQKL